MISREIAENLSRRCKEDGDIRQAIENAGGLDVAACEAAGIAHDLGHPPFGHAGESELNRLLRTRGVTEGFEGNAQSFRIVCTLDVHNYARGLDLSNVVLAAILKYPWMRPKDAPGAQAQHQEKFGAYASEREHLRRARKGVLPHIDDERLLAAHESPPQSLEASIMDLADDIAYSVHDLEDFCSQGFIDLSLAVEKLKEFRVRPDAPHNTFAASVTKLKEFNEEFDLDEYQRAAGRVGLFLENVNLPKISQSARDMQLRGDLSTKIADFFGSLKLAESEGTSVVTLASPQWHEMQLLKRVTKGFLVTTGRMSQIQRAQRQTIERLFLGLEDWIYRADEDDALPETLVDFMGLQDKGSPIADNLLGPGVYRAIADYICTMSDSEAFLRAQWVTGTEIPGMANLGLVE